MSVVWRLREGKLMRRRVGKMSETPGQPIDGVVESEVDRVGKKRNIEPNAETQSGRGLDSKTHTPSSSTGRAHTAHTHTRSTPRSTQSNQFEAMAAVAKPKAKAATKPKAPKVKKAKVSKKASKPKAAKKSPKKAKKSPKKAAAPKAK